MVYIKNSFENNEIHKSERKVAYMLISSPEGFVFFSPKLSETKSLAIPKSTKLSNPPAHG